jgi:hypothetical protein
MELVGLLFPVVPEFQNLESFAQTCFFSLRVGLGCLLCLRCATNVQVCQNTKLESYEGNSFFPSSLLIPVSVRQRVFSVRNPSAATSDGSCVSGSSMASWTPRDDDSYTRVLESVSWSSSFFSLLPSPTQLPRPATSVVALPRAAEPQTSSGQNGPLRRDGTLETSGNVGTCSESRGRNLGFRCSCVLRARVVCVRWGKKWRPR